MRKVAATALGGTSIELYDFFLYGTAAALVFPTLFFPEDMPRYMGLIYSFSTFAVGFLARPIGGAEGMVYHRGMASRGLDAFLGESGGIAAGTRRARTERSRLSDEKV